MEETLALTLLLSGLRTGVKHASEGDADDLAPPATDLHYVGWPALVVCLRIRRAFVVHGLGS
jgi:hypothetical protein